MVPKGYLGITIFPFVFLKTKDLKLNRKFMNHENIHKRQQLELLVFPFYLVYGIEFLIRIIQYKNWDLAYRNISFEREAYTNELQLDYLKHRKFWSFLKYHCSNEFLPKA